MYDTTNKNVEISIDTASRRVWVNVDGQCKLRVYNCKTIYVDGELVLNEIKDIAPTA